MTSGPAVGYLLGLPPVGVRALVGLVERAAQAGRTVHLPEHAARPGYFPSALAAAGFLIGAVPSARVRTAGVVAGSRDPVSVVRDAAALADAARSGDGWFGLGVVAGWDPVDLPGGRFERRFRALDDLCAAARQREFELVLGGAGPVNLRRASRTDGLLAGTGHDVPDLRRLAAAFRALGGSQRVVAIRRWVPDGADVPEARTPDSAVVRGADAARVHEQLAGVVDEVVFGPVDSARSLAELEAYLGSQPSGRAG